MTTLTFNIQFTDETKFNDAFDLIEPDQDQYDRNFNKIFIKENMILNEIDPKKLTYDANQPNQSSDLKSTNTHLVVFLILNKIFFSN